jgi:deoxyribonuclease V
LNYDSLEVLETQNVTQQVKFQYVATLLSFRELPVIAACIRKLKLQPDVILVDGHGRAHPFRWGLASHLGVALQKPTVGVAKSRLIGESIDSGQDVFLKLKGQIIVAVLQTQVDIKPIYVSIGRMVSLGTAVKIVRHFVRSFRVPEPVRIAHLMAEEERKVKIAAARNMGVGENFVEPETEGISR